MKEHIDIKTIHLQIQRIKPQWEILKKKIESDIDNPSFAEFVVRNNSDERYLLQTIESLIAMYNAYLEATTNILVNDLGIEKETNKNNEELDDLDNEVIEDVQSFDVNSIPKRKAGRPKKNMVKN